MTPTVLVLALLVIVIAAFVGFRRISRASHHGAYADLGVVSTRWIAELRRDEPWSGS